MATYWCKFFDAGGRVSGAEKMVRPDDVAVIAAAQVAYKTYDGDYEIWDGMRLVHRVTREIPA